METQETTQCRKWGEQLMKYEMVTGGADGLKRMISPLHSVALADKSALLWSLTFSLPFISCHSTVPWIHTWVGELLPYFPFKLFSHPLAVMPTTLFFLLTLQRAPKGHVWHQQYEFCALRECASGGCH